MKDYNKIIKELIKDADKFGKKWGNSYGGSAYGIETIKINGKVGQVQIRIEMDEDDFLPFVKLKSKSEELK